MKNPYWLAFVCFAFASGLAIGVLGTMAFRPQEKKQTGEPRPINGQELRAFMESRVPQFFEIPLAEERIKAGEVAFEGIMRIVYTSAGVPVSPRLLAAQRQSEMYSRIQSKDKAKVRDSRDPRRLTK